MYIGDDGDGVVDAFMTVIVKRTATKKGALYCYVFTVMEQSFFTVIIIRKNHYFIIFFIIFS
jgi:hypothetical protein